MNAYKNEKYEKKRRKKNERKINIKRTRALVFKHRPAFLNNVFLRYIQPKSYPYLLLYSIHVRNSLFAYSSIKFSTKTKNPSYFTS